MLHLGHPVAALAAPVHRAGGLLEAHPPPLQEGAYRGGGMVRHMAAPIPGPLPPPAPLALVDRSREGALRALLALLALLALVVVLYTAAALPPPPGVLAPAPVPPPVPLALGAGAHNMKCPPPALLALEAPETLHMAAGLAPAGLHMTATRALVVVLHLEEGLLQAPLGLKQNVNQ